MFSVACFVGTFAEERLLYRLNAMASLARLPFREMWPSWIGIGSDDMSQVPGARASRAAVMLAVACLGGHALGAREVDLRGGPGRAPAVVHGQDTAEIAVRVAKAWGGVLGAPVETVLAAQVMAPGTWRLGESWRSRPLVLLGSVTDNAAMFALHSRYLDGELRSLAAWDSGVLAGTEHGLFLLDPELRPVARATGPVEDIEVVTFGGSKPMAVAASSDGTVRAFSVQP